VRVDLGESAASAVSGSSDLVGATLVEASKHGEFGELLVAQPKRAQ
jgi:hypothetical protein